MSELAGDAANVPPLASDRHAADVSRCSKTSLRRTRAYRSPSFSDRRQFDLHRSRVSQRHARRHPQTSDRAWSSASGRALPKLFRIATGDAALDALESSFKKPATEPERLSRAPVVALTGLRVSYTSTVSARGGSSKRSARRLPCARRAVDLRLIAATLATRSAQENDRGLAGDEHGSAPTGHGFHDRQHDPAPRISR